MSALISFLELQIFSIVCNAIEGENPNGEGALTPGAYAEEKTI